LSTTQSNLATAFSKLISDLGGSTSASSPATAATSSATAQTPTAALQSFLSSFLQDLQNGGSASNTRGNTVNVTA
jgi:hypothetical protein